MTPEGEEKMSYAYQANLWCDSCGRKLTVEYPSYGSNGKPADTVYHCAAEENCLEAIDLHKYGLLETDPLYGLESRFVGAIVSGLTADGIENLHEMLDRPDPTPYQRALHALWRETFRTGRGREQMKTGMLEAAIQRAEDRAQRAGMRMTVYHVAHDQWGRDAVFFVRSDGEGPPLDEKFETVYSTGTER